MVVVFSFTPRDLPLPPLTGFSLKWYGQLLPPDYNTDIINALFTSIRLGVFAAIGSGIIGTLAALGIVRANFHSKLGKPQALTTFFLAPMVIPGLVSAISLLTFFSYLKVQGSFLALLMGHILITLPYVVTVVSSQLYGFDQSLEEAAKNLGANPLRTFYEITLPLIAPGIVAGMVFAFMISFDNFIHSFFWTSADNQTLPVVIASMLRYGITPEVNAIGTVMIVGSAVLATIAQRISAGFF